MESILFPVASHACAFLNQGLTRRIQDWLWKEQLREESQELLNENMAGEETAMRIRRENKKERRN